MVLAFLCSHLRVYLVRGLVNSCGVLLFFFSPEKSSH